MSDLEGLAHCRFCVDDKTKSKCEHRLPLVSGYGFGRVSGWRGIGVTYRCPDCWSTLWFEEDYGCYTEEIEHNAIKKEDNKKWGEAVANGQYE